MGDMLLGHLSHSGIIYSILVCFMITEDRKLGIRAGFSQGKQCKLFIGRILRWDDKVQHKQISHRSDVDHYLCQSVFLNLFNCDSRCCFFGLGVFSLGLSRHFVSGTAATAFLCHFCQLQLWNCFWSTHFHINSNNKLFPKFKTDTQKIYSSTKKERQTAQVTHTWTKIKEFPVINYANMHKFLVQFFQAVNLTIIISYYLVTSCHQSCTKSKNTHFDNTKKCIKQVKSFEIDSQAFSMLSW